MPPLKNSEAIVLRSSPFHEADLLVTFFTREEGKVRGVARAAKRSRKRFGGALEPLTYVRVYYEDREGRDLARVDTCEVLESPLSDAVDYPRAVALGHVAEVLDQLLPDREANDTIFRLALAVLRHIRAASIWMPVTYFQLWIVRLTGLLPDMSVCVVCGDPLEGVAAYCHPLSDGLMCAEHRRLASSEMSARSRTIARHMFRAPVAEFDQQPWPREMGLDLRNFLTQHIERHLERKLITATMLERLD